jgi:hypothetical protein
MTQFCFFLLKLQHTTRVGLLNIMTRFCFFTESSAYNPCRGITWRRFLQFNEELGLKNIEFKSLVPRMFLPSFLKDTLGYRTHAMVSLPVLNPRTVLNSGRNSYKLMDKHNDMRPMLQEMKFDGPSFYLLNVGETHYPYALPDERPDQWPRISGVHGVFKHLDDEVVGEKLKRSKGEKFFDTENLEMLRKRQIATVQYLDKAALVSFANCCRGTASLPLLPQSRHTVQGMAKSGRI